MQRLLLQSQGIETQDCHCHSDPWQHKCFTQGFERLKLPHSPILREVQEVFQPRLFPHSTLAYTNVLIYLAMNTLTPLRGLQKMTANNAS